MEIAIKSTIFYEIKWIFVERSILAGLKDDTNRHQRSSIQQSMLPIPANLPNDVKEYIREAYVKSQKWSLPNGQSYKNCDARQIKHVGIIGGGTMGRGIGISFVHGGYDVTIVERNEEASESCKKELLMELNLKHSSENGSAIRQKNSWIHSTTNYSSLASCELVIEAIFENMALKKELFTKLEKICPASTIFATNTSSLNIDEMSSVLLDPSRVVGIHFLNPPHVNPIVEVVYALRTVGEAVATAFEALTRMKKVPILVGNSSHFVFNRSLTAYLLQAQKLMYQYGFLPNDVDNIVASSGNFMGPFAILDLIGIDVVAQVRGEQGKELTVLEKEMLKRNRLGRKTGKGFYAYDSASKKRSNDAEVETLIRDVVHERNRNIQLYSESDVMDFILFPMINEAFFSLEEGIIADESVLDLMFILGFGWPAVWGGPIKYAKSRGVRALAEKMHNWHALEPEEKSYALCTTFQKTRKSSKL